MVPAAAGSSSLGLKDALPLTLELECASILLRKSAVRNPGLHIDNVSMLCVVRLSKKYSDTEASLALVNRTTLIE